MYWFSGPGFQRVQKARGHISILQSVNNSNEHLLSNIHSRGHVGMFRKDENRVISMSLYGSNPRYTRGAIENAKLVDKVFPGWKLRIYLSNASNLAVPHDIVHQLESLNVD